MTNTPMVLEGFFTPSHKYGCSVAMVLDGLDQSFADDVTGNVDWHFHQMVFYDIDVTSAYKIVTEYIDTECNPGFCCQPVNDTLSAPTWYEARQMIDLLVEGKNWSILTDSNGFVAAFSYAEKAALQKAFDLVSEAYGEWLGDDV